MSYGPRPWQQTNWDWRAAANFMLGGTGAGLVIAAALALPAPRPAILVALLLIAGGLGAVWLEIGRKLRAIHVFFNPQTSWMTRESLAAVILFGFGISYLVINESWMQHAAALAALAFVVCQARILRAAKGIPAWRAPESVPLIVGTALAEGAGAALLFDAGTFMLSLSGLAVIARALAWTRYLSAAKQPGRGLMQLGTVAALALLLAAYYVPPAAPLAGLVAIAAGWRFKYVLVTRAAFNQGFSLPNLPVRGSR